MKKLSKTILTVLATGVLSCGLFSQQAQAAPITGDIQFAGEVAFDTNSLATATRVVTWFDIFHNAGFANVTSATGAIAGFVSSGDQASMPNAWIFNPSTPTAALWSVGGFTFDLLSSTVVTQNATTLVIEGIGTVSGNGFDTTVMSWSFTTQSAGGNTRTSFSFSSNGASVPDGGSAVALLGIVLIGLEVLRRKLSIT